MAYPRAATNEQIAQWKKDQPVMLIVWSPLLLALFLGFIVLLIPIYIVVGFMYGWKKSYLELKEILIDNVFK